MGLVERLSGVSCKGLKGRPKWCRNRVVGARPGTHANYHFETLLKDADSKAVTKLSLTHTVRLRLALSYEPFSPCPTILLHQRAHGILDRPPLPPA